MSSMILRPEPGTRKTHSAAASTSAPAASGQRRKRPRQPELWAPARVTAARKSRRVSLEGGLSYLTRDFLAAKDTEELTVRLGAEVGWSPGRLMLSERLVIYPSFEDDSLQLRSETSLTTSILADWALELANVLEYDSAPRPGLERLDLLWTLGLQYAFR